MSGHSQSSIPLPRYFYWDSDCNFKMPPCFRFTRRLLFVSFCLILPPSSIFIFMHFFRILRTTCAELVTWSSLTWIAAPERESWSSATGKPAMNIFSIDRAHSAGWPNLDELLGNVDRCNTNDPAFLRYLTLPPFLSRSAQGWHGERHPQIRRYWVQEP